MSSGEEEIQTSGPIPKSKKRRTPRACDFCRKRKIRCNSEEMPDNQCSNCIEFGNDCTHDEVGKKRTSVKGYIAELETKVAVMTKLLEGQHISSDAPQFFVDTGPSAASGPRIPPIQLLTDIGGAPLSTEDVEHEVLTTKMRRFPMKGDRFIGKGSTFVLLQTAMDHKEEITGGSTESIKPNRPEFCCPHPSEVPVSEEPEPPPYIFPDPDLIESLTSLYFTKVNTFLPLLHRPTFERLITEELHLTDRMFGATVLLVCALGAQHSNDPRVFIGSTDSKRTSGCKWATQVQLLRQKNFLQTPSLYELQAYCLIILWLQYSSIPHALWPMVGLGIRLAQDVGWHRRKPYTPKWTVEDELKKRAFWILVCHDRNISAFLGRPRAMQDEDFDLDLPIECDDEYWENPDSNLAFKQPPGKPSTVAFFNSSLQLGHVMGYVLRTICSIRKSKIMLGLVGPKWEQQVVAELDSSLNKWVDSVPEHLRWNPNRENDLFFNQSAALYTSYYHLQILIHRPFIPTPHKPSTLTFPSLAICTNAARCCSRVAYTQVLRCPLPRTHVHMAVFVSGIVLLLKIWSERRSGTHVDTTKEMEDVHKCMHVLKLMEDRWYAAGRFWDILYMLSSAGELPLPDQKLHTRTKRRREDDGKDSSVNLPPLSSNIASSLHESEVDIKVPLNTFTESSPSSSDPRSTSFMSPLPIYTDELGKFPLPGYSDYGIEPAEAHSNPLFGPDGFDLFGELPMNGFQDVNPLHDGQPQPTIPVEKGWDPNLEPLLAFDLDPVSQTAVDDSHLSMWSHAPASFGLNDWGMYLSTVGGQ